MPGTKGHSGGKRIPGPGKALGRPPLIHSTVLRVGDGIAIKYAMEGGSTPLEWGEVIEIKRGITRTTVIKLRNGETVYLLAETPKAA